MKNKINWVKTTINILQQATGYLHFLLMLLLGLMLGAMLGVVGLDALGFHASGFQTVAMMLGAGLGLALGFWFGKKLFLHAPEPLVFVQEQDLPTDVWESRRAEAEYSWRFLMAKFFAVIFLAGFMCMIFAYLAAQNNAAHFFGLGKLLWFQMGVGLCVFGLPSLYFWRCPNCAKNLGREWNPRFCQHCYVKLRH